MDTYILLDEISILLIIIVIALFASVLTVLISEIIGYYLYKNEEDKYEEYDLDFKEEIAKLLNVLHPGFIDLDLNGDNQKVKETIDLSKIPLPEKNNDKV